MKPFVYHLLSLSLILPMSMTNADPIDNANIQQSMQQLTPSHWRSIQRKIGKSFEQTYIKASNTDAKDFFGRTIALSGNTLVVGAFLEDSNGSKLRPDDLNPERYNQEDNTKENAGAVYVFSRNNKQDNDWVQQAYLKALEPQEDEGFGRLVAIEGDTIAITAGNQFFSGSSEVRNGVYIFERSGNDWIQKAHIFQDNLIFSIAFNNGTLVLGCAFEAVDNTPEITTDDAFTLGAVHIYNKVENNWIETFTLSSPAINAFGLSVALEGDTLVVGAPGTGDDDGLNAEELKNMGYNGKVYVFKRINNNEWFTSAILQQPEKVQSFFGFRVALSGNTIAVGSLTVLDLEIPSTKEVVYLFTQNIAVWEQSAKIQASNTELGDQFGSSLVLEGDTLIVGAENENGKLSQEDNDSPHSGAVYVFTRTQKTWSQQAYIKAKGIKENDLFGTSLALDGNLLVVGSTGDNSAFSGISDNRENDNNAINSGAVFSMIMDLSETHKSNIIFDWIERFFVKFFPNFLNTFSFDGYLARGPYPRTGNYIGTKNGKLYVFGEQWGGLVEVGDIDTYYNQALNQTK